MEIYLRRTENMGFEGGVSLFDERQVLSERQWVVVSPIRFDEGTYALRSAGISVS